MSLETPPPLPVSSPFSPSASAPEKNRSGTSSSSSASSPYPQSHSNPPNSSPVHIPQAQPTPTNRQQTQPRATPPSGGGASGATPTAAASSDSQQFCLRWNNYQSNLTSVFDQLLQNESFVDVTLSCEGQSIKAHKVVLSACSPYFQSLFLDNPCSHPIIIMRDVRWIDLKAVIEFMYKGEINVSQDQIGPLLRVAETLKIRGLADVSGDSELETQKPTSGASKKSAVDEEGEDTSTTSSAKRPRKRRRLSTGSNRQGAAGASDTPPHQDVQTEVASPVATAPPPTNPKPLPSSAAAAAFAASASLHSMGLSFAGLSHGDDVDTKAGILAAAAEMMPDEERVSTKSSFTSFKAPYGVLV